MIGSKQKNTKSRSKGKIKSTHRPKQKKGRWKTGHEAEQLSGTIKPLNIWGLPIGSC